MFRRLVSIALLLWLGVFTSVIVPSHRVGRIPVPGAKAVDGPLLRGLLAQETPQDSCCSQPPEEKKDQPSRAKCAVCYWVAKLDAATPSTTTVPDLGLLPQRAASLNDSLQSNSSLLTIRSRDPPHPRA